ncbi:MAG: sugar transferase [Planctomycetales bacterium]|nr:sugar transferase [Planctomycetales bacterium]
MLAWIRKRASSKWTRRTHWTPLLQNQREFQRTLAKERSRVEREGAYFGLIILRLQDLQQVRPQTIKLAKLLHRRLRVTDEKGHLGLGRLGVLLPATSAEGTQLVLDTILRCAAQNQLQLEGEAFIYPESDDDASGSQPLPPRGARLPAGRLGSAPVALMVPNYPSWKRMLDIGGAATILLFSGPILLLCILLVKLTSRGPALFAQTRTGYLGRPFTIYKLRTMVVNAAELQPSLRKLNERDGPAFKLRRDPRVTPLGNLLRATGLDELPQLWNVLKGDMSLVGPRPLPVAEAAQCLPWQVRRHEVKPGLTCFWQLTKGRRVTFVEWMRLDLHYTRVCSLTLDLQLILRTISAAVLGRVGH